MQILSHELIHILNDEFERNCGTVEEKALQIIEEIRADIEGKKLLNLKGDDIDRAFDLCIEFNDDGVKEEEYFYNNCYPTYQQRKEFTKNYDEVTEDLIRKIFSKIRKYYTVENEDEIVKKAVDKYSKMSNKFCDNKYSESFWKIN
ncbi:hypothetical protein P8V03_18830 [Clostridium sp. A1-XYC3]|uniref:Uncharacterized protein n=1 Tax=Clostridium tanneri TaxID=3037988 RepID=A0ABU4JYD4_9CLOT|nr:hypothetical protein [Clostridium sp. A1-XYC3]MDW8803186.1 hypothetical protein [Clostridium sp. A1-XYC3]